MGKLKTKEEFTNEMLLINPNIIIIGDYVGARKKIHCRCSIDGHEWFPTPSNLLRNKGCPKCGRVLKYTHDQFERKVLDINSNICILGQYVNMDTKIKCKCKIDGHEWDAYPRNLFGSSGCPVCSNKKIMIGVNDIWTTHPEIAKLLNNLDDGHKYSFGSNKKLNWKCSECGAIIKNKSIVTVNRYNLSCPICSDGISYPEKFMSNLLLQLGLDFEYQKKFDWCQYVIDGRECYGIYDFYLSNYKTIIEMDGAFHNNDNLMSGRSVETSKSIDSKKDALAFSNDVALIRIDSAVSELNYLKNNILSSCLANILDLSQIDWVEIEKSSRKSIIKAVCDYKNKNKELTTTDLRDIFKLNRSTIYDYLKIGSDCGWCEYDPAYEKRVGTMRSNQKNSKRIICITTGQIYESISEASRSLNMRGHHISECCNNIRKSSGKLADGTPLKWMYYNDYIIQETERMTKDK